MASTATTRKSGRSTGGGSRHRAFSALMVAPTALYFLVWMIVPTLYGLWLSLNKTSLNGRARFVGGQNYVDLVSNKQFLSSLLITGVYTLEVVVPTLLLAIVLGRVLSLSGRSNGLFMTIYFLPFILTGVAVGIVFSLLFQRYGMVNEILGTGIAWLSDANWALTVVSAATVWSMVGYYTIILAAGYRQIPQEVTEAAMIDGTGAFRRLLFIELPMLRPTLIFSMVTAVAAVLTNFGMPYIMTHGGPADATMTLPLVIYNQSFMYGAVGKSSAMAIVLLVIALLLTLAIVRLASERQTRKA